MERFWSLTVGIVLGAWFLASVVHQFRPRWWRRVTRFDPLHLLPIWTFFAPNPGRHDLHVIYRECSGVRCGPWRQLAPPWVDRSWRWIWNPGRYVRKATTDFSNALLDARRTSDDQRAVLLSAAYISLLHWVMAQPSADPESNHRQFALVVTQGFGEGRELDVQFVSEVHRAVA